MADPKDIFRKILEQGARAIAPDVAVEIHIERPKNPEHGDLSSNLVMQLAKQSRRNPRELARQFVEATEQATIQSGITDAITIAGAGFLNIRLKPAAKLQSIRRVLEQGRDYGRSKGKPAGKTQVEFVSAN